MLPSFIGFGDAILLGVSKDNVHVFVECEKSTHHHSGILKSDSDSEVNPLQELASLRCHFIIE